jgi:hypothetical protein
MAYVDGQFCDRILPRRHLEILARMPSGEKQRLGFRMVAMVKIK